MARARVIWDNLSHHLSRPSPQQLAYINLKRPDKSTTQGSRILAGPVTQFEPELLQIVIPGQKKPWVFTNHLTNAEWLKERANLCVKLRARILHKIICREALDALAEASQPTLFILQPKLSSMIGSDPRPARESSASSTQDSQDECSSVVTETSDSEDYDGDREWLPPRQRKNRQKATSCRRNASKKNGPLAKKRKAVRKKDS